jgi:hypothetical protein
MLIVAHSLSPYLMLIDAHWLCPNLMLIVAVHSPIVVHSLSPLPDPQSTRCLHSPSTRCLHFLIRRAPAVSIHRSPSPHFQ